jgi:hypothetical protein
MRAARIGLVAAMMAFGIGCGGGGPVPVAPKPFRPPAKPIIKPKPVQTDCPVTVIEALDPAVPYEKRVIVESNNLSSQAIKQLGDANKEGMPAPDRESLFLEAVEGLKTALVSDPYNVAATYYLASAYASIERPQCAVNLLERLALLRKLGSHTAGVEARVDRLLGRDNYKGKLDPAFDHMRADERFRTVVEKLIAPL